FDIWSILKVFLVILFIIFLYWIREIILTLFLGFLFALVFTPIVDFLERKRVNRYLGSFVVYLILLAVIASIVLSLTPIVTQQFRQLINNFSDYYQKVKPYLEFKFLDSKFSQDIFSRFLDLKDFGITNKSIFGILGKFAGWVAIIITVFVVAFYISAQKSYLKKSFLKLLPEKFQGDVAHLMKLIEKDLGGWARGLLILCLTIGVMSFIGLKILGVNYALLLGIFAGLTEAIPWFGPLMGALPAVLIGFLQSPLKGIFVAVLYFVIQQIENTVLVPNVMKHTVGLNPLLVIIIILIGAKLAGAIGMLLAVPLVSIFIIIGKEYLRLKKIGKFRVENN
ncbi:AI-2E family transporter, partial [bacterium]|nr:AI-2E family transporter [bacterium]